MNIKILLTFSLIFFSLNIFSSSSNEELIVSERFDELVRKVDGMQNPNWQNSFYAAYSHFKLKNFYRANLYASKSLIENPLEKNTAILAKAIHEKISDTSSVDLIISTGKQKLAYLVTILLLISFVALFWRGKKMRLLISGFGLFVVLFGGFFFHVNPLFAKPIFSVLGADGIIRLSPSSESEAKIDFGKESLLVVVREVGNWIFVNDLSGRSGWVNKDDLIMSQKYP